MSPLMTTDVQPSHSIAPPVTPASVSNAVAPQLALALSSHTASILLQGLPRYTSPCNSFLPVALTAQELFYRLDQLLTKFTPTTSSLSLYPHSSWPEKCQPRMRTSTSSELGLVAARSLLEWTQPVPQPAGRLPGGDSRRAQR